MANRIQLRRDGAQQWANVNPTLAQGELGIEIDTGRIKIGDGVTTWNQLKYERPIEAETNTANTLVKRDADGGFAAGAITGTLIGNASTATRLANARQLTLAGDLVGAGTFDGSSNLNLVAQLSFINTLPHYNPLNENATGTYTKVTVDSQGRVRQAQNPTTIAGYGLVDAQPLDVDLTSFAGISTVGIITRASEGNIVTRAVVVADTGRITIQNGNAVSGNPTLDLAETGVAAAGPGYFGSGATQKLFNVPSIAGATQTIFASRVGVDIWGRIYSITDFPIATAVEGTTAPTWATATSYSRYDKVVQQGRLYQALNSGTSQTIQPVHNSGDVSDGGVTWRHLGTVTTRQKGLASFDQEDFDVDSNGHVVIAAAGVDNTQLQNNQIRFADGNSFTSYELDNELTSTTGYRGITTINDLSVNNTSGDPLLKCLAADNNVDINTTTSTIFSDITLDKTSNTIQTINRAGSLTILMDANTASNRFLRLTANNTGSGDAKIEIAADESIDITSTNTTISLLAPQQISLISSSADVRVEDFYFANNTLSSTNSTIILDPAGIGDDTGTVQIKGNLQVDGTTTTVNSTTITIDDVVLTLGGDQTPTTDDNKDRGIEFKYYDTEARLGFFGWDDSYSTLASTTGGYRFLYNATNTSEVFSGTDAGLIAGNLALSSNVNSTSTTTGTLVVTGGTGISGNLWVGGNANIASNTVLQGTLAVTNLATFNNGVTITGNTTAATEFFRITDGASTPVTKFLVDSATGNTTIQGTLSTTGATTLSSTLGVTGDTTLTGNLTTQSASTVNIQNTANSNVTAAIAGTAYASLGTYGALKVDGGVSIANSLVVGGSFKVYGQFDVDGAVSYSGNTIFKGNVSIDNDGTSPFKFNIASNTARLDSIGQIVTSNATDSTSTTTGAVIVTGGVGIAKQLRVGGAATITGASTLTSTLNVTGATTLSSTLGVTGIATVSNTTDSTATNTGALVVSGGAGIASQLRVGGATTLGSTLAVTGITTLSNNFNAFGSNNILGDAASDALTVNATTTFTAPVTISGAQPLVVGGNTTIYGNLIVEGTTTTVNSVTMTVDDKNIELGSIASPTNTTADGGGITLKGTTDKTISWINSTGAWTLSEHLNLAAGKEYRINGIAVVDSSRNLVNIANVVQSGNLTINTNKFTVSSASGNTVIAGTLAVAAVTTLSSSLNVTGATTLSNTLAITGDVAINTNKFNITAASGNTTIAGTLGVTGATTLNSSLGVTGATTLSSTLGVTGATTLSSTLGVTGNTTLTGTLTATSLATFNGGLTIAGSTTPATEFFRITDGAGTPVTKFLVDSASGNTTISGALGVIGTTSLNSSLGVTGATTLSSTLGVTGTTTLTGALIANSNVTIGDAASDQFTVNANSLFTGSLTLSNSLTTTSNVTITGGILSIRNSSGVDRFVFNPSTSSASITGTLAVSSTTTLSSSLGVSGPTTLSSSLGVTGATTLSSTLSVTDNVTLNRNVTIVGSNTAATELFKIQNASAVDKFTVDSSSGNTTIAGTLAVTGGTTLSSTLGVTGNTSITGTLGVTGVSTFTGLLTANGGISGALTGNASTATTLQTARTIGISGDGTGTATSFNGSANITIPFTLANSGVTAGTYTKVIVDAKGRVTTGTNATTSDIAEGTNQYYTQGRFDTAFGAKTTTNLAEGTNLYYTQTRFDTAFTAKSTTNLTEGTNLYFTNERAQDATATALVTNGAHSGVTVTYDDAGNAININRNALTYSNVSYTADGTQTAFVSTTGRASDGADILVIVGGLIQTPSTEYTYSNQTILNNVVGHRGENTVVVSSATGLVVGQPVSGTGIAANATITNISGTTITLSANNLTALRRAEISTIGTPSGAAVESQANTSYTAVASTSSGTGTGATFNVSRGALGEIVGVTVNNGGTNYTAGSTITISGLLVGGSSSAENIQFTVSAINTTTTTATFSSVVKLTAAPTAGVNVSIRYLPL